jgi:hypothetical protein
MRNEEREVRLNRDEAEVLARYWADKCEDAESFCLGEPCYRRSALPGLWSGGGAGASHGHCGRRN